MKNFFEESILFEIDPLEDNNTELEESIGDILYQGDPGYDPASIQAGEDMDDFERHFILDQTKFEE